MKELYIYIIYDVKSIKIKNKIIEKCKDYGLTKIYSFILSGYINKNKIDKLKIDLEQIFANCKYMLMMIPINNISDRYCYFFTNKQIKKKQQKIQDKIYFGMKLNRKFLNFVD